MSLARATSYATFIKALCVPLLCGLLCCHSRVAPEVEQAIVPPAGVEVIVLCDSTFVGGRTDTLSLGRIREGEVVSRSLYYRNSTSEALLFLSSNSSCGCTSVDLPARPIPVGECTKLSFEFATRGFAGMQFKRIRLYTTASPAPIEVLLTAEVE